MIVIDGVEMVDVREAARLARRTPETIRRWVWSGRLDAVKTGNRLLIARSQILEVEPDPPAPAGTLTDWMTEAAVLRKASKASKGSSAADLVLADRDDRGPGAGR